MMLTALRTNLIGLLVFLPAISVAPQVLAEKGDANVEQLLLVGLELLQQGQINVAIDNLQQVVEQQPDFKLAQLVYGDLLMAKARGITDLGNAMKKYADPISEFKDELQKRWLATRQLPPAGSIPRGLLQLSPTQKRAIAIDMEQSRLYLFENQGQGPVLASHYYISIGKNGAGKQTEGDLRTPVGVYFISRRLEGEDLPDLYGAGALPINYPNAWDRHRGKTGGGIWLHGTPSDTFSRSPRSSEGCVALPNIHFEQINHLVEVDQKTPVIIAERLEWLAPNEVDRIRAQFHAQLSQWERDWESLNTGRYLSHYAADFRSPFGGLDQWSLQKQQVAENKRFIDISLENVSILHQPGSEELIVTTFDQVYRSNTKKSRMTKRQYWRKSKGRWQIIFEGDISSVPLTKVARVVQ